MVPATKSSGETTRLPHLHQQFHSFHWNKRILFLKCFKINDSLRHLTHTVTGCMSAANKVSIINSLETDFFITRDELYADFDIN